MKTIFQTKIHKKNNQHTITIPLHIIRYLNIQPEETIYLEITTSKYTKKNKIILNPSNNKKLTSFNKWKK